MKNTNPFMRHFAEKKLNGNYMKNLKGVILAVDDNRDNLTVLEFLFSPFPNIRVEVAISGLEALEKLKNFDFDLILLDIDMPIMDGYEVAQQIKCNEKNKI